MESHELLREIFDQKAPKEVSADLELSTSMVYKWAQPRAGEGSGIENPLDRVEALFQSTGDRRLIQWLCQRAGGFFILNPKDTPHPHFLIPATNQIVQEFADLLQVVASAAADNQITPAEAKQIRARWEELKSATEGFVVCCENGNFGAMKKETSLCRLTGYSSGELILDKIFTTRTNKLRKRFKVFRYGNQHFLLSCLGSL